MYCLETLTNPSPPPPLRPTPASHSHPTLPCTLRLRRLRALPPQWLFYPACLPPDPCRHPLCHQSQPRPRQPPPSPPPPPPPLNSSAFTSDCRLIGSSCPC